MIAQRVEKKGLRPRLAAAVIATVWLVAIVVFGIVEHLLDRQSFESVWDGMWWATQTVTTVGYGDVVPDEGAGRMIASVLMIGGLSLFAVVTGAITSAFVAHAQAETRAEGRRSDAGEDDRDPSFSWRRSERMCERSRPASNEGPPREPDASSPP